MPVYSGKIHQPSWIRHVEGLGKPTQHGSTLNHRLPISGVNRNETKSKPLIIISRERFQAVHYERSAEIGGLTMPHRDEQIIIFEHRDFRGRHRHIFGQEANLNNGEDNTLNDRMSSFVVLSGTWSLFRHSNFVEQVGGRTFGPGQYEFVGDFAIPNDAVSSLRAA